VDKLETLEVSGTPEDIGFTIGQADADSIQKQVLQLASFITAGFFYLCCTFCIVWFFKWVEKHWYAHLRPRIS
jgi:ABC-type arginine/histidine transport system permease subunit